MGLENYKDMFSDPIVWKAFWNNMDFALFYHVAHHHHRSSDFQPSYAATRCAIPAFYGHTLLPERDVLRGGLLL